MSGKGRTVLVGWLLLAAIAFLVLWRQRSGIEVSVRNEETFAVRDVEVLTSAGRYPLGDLRPGDSASTTVGADGESSLSVAWIDDAGSRHEREANVYFEGRPDGIEMYGGYVDFEIAGGAARSEQRVETAFSPFSRPTPPPAR